MKLKTIGITSHKLIKLELLKSKFIKPNIQKKESNLFNFFLHIKKLLLIIYKYHLTNKKISFFGVPESMYLKHKRVLRNSNHLFFPESYWEKGLLANKVNIFKYLKKKINSISHKHKKLNTKVTSYFLIKKKPDLIVILNENDENISLLAEATKLKIPIINFNEIKEASLETLKTNPYKQRKKESFFFALIYSILKRKVKINAKKKTI